MFVREYTDADLDALLAMHRAQGFNYPFPDLRDPIFVSKLVLCEGDLDANAQGAADPRAGVTQNSSGKGNCGGSENNGVSRRDSREQKIVMAALARLTCEIYLLADPHAGTPRRRYARLLALHRAAAADLRARGLDDAHAWLPPRIAARFGRRLENLGWIRDDRWTPYCFPLR